MNRRIAVIATLASVYARPALAQSGNGERLRQLIDEVILKGDLSNLDSLVTEDIEIPGSEIRGRDSFKRLSEYAYQDRAEKYESMSMDFVSIADTDTHAHALVLFEGKQKSGGTSSQWALYAAEFRDGLVRYLYIGS